VISGFVLVLLAGRPTSRFVPGSPDQGLAGRERAGAHRDPLDRGAPLDNYSGDPAQDYFAEGMTDELTTSSPASPDCA